MSLQPFKPKLFLGTMAARKLRELGLQEENLVRAVEAGEFDRRNCSPLEPSIAPGVKAWCGTFRVLAEELVPRGWERVEELLLPRMVNRGKAVAIAVVSGDDGTGLPTRIPRSKRARGERSVRLVRSNNEQLTLFPEKEFKPMPHPDELTTWWLLIHSDGADVLRAELSIAIGLDEEGRLAAWDSRVIIDLPPAAPPARVEPDYSDGEEPEVTVRPKRGR